MPESSVPYDRPLPEIPGRRPWEPPTSFLVKDEAHASGWRVDDSGRRPSELMLVPKIREAVDGWRDGGYPGASDVTRQLFRHWFDEEHYVAELRGPLRFHFGQREAIETLAWLVEVFGERDALPLIRDHWTRIGSEVVPVPPKIETTMEGRRRVRWRLPRVGDQTQDLPPEALRRYALRMATGSGKTWVMAMAVVWAHLHWRLVPGSPLSANFLVVAPNVIVYERLRKDFEGNRIFGELPLIPPQWRTEFDQRVIVRDAPTEPAESGNLFLTNIQQLYDRSRHWEPKNPVDALLGDDSGIATGQRAGRSILERVASLPDLIVMNDEAHHVHDEDLRWSQSLLDLHQGLPDGLAAWLDFSATPKDQGGLFFPWTVCDYPLQQAVEDRIVKAPVIVTHEDDAGRPPTDPDRVTGANAAEKYRYWLDAAVHCLKRHEKAYRPLEVQPILFVMTETIAHAKAVARHFGESSAYGFAASEILVIHTDAKGGIRKSDLDALRQAARDVDSPDSGVRVIVSVMMLREGWDVRNVSVVLGLRPFSAKSEILPEQVIGRGLRLMRDVTPDQTQTLEVLGTTRLLETLRRELETQGVSVSVQKTPPPTGVIIEPVREKCAYDIALPMIETRLHHEFGGVSDVDVGSLHSILENGKLPDATRLRLQMEFATTETEIHQEEALIAEPPPASSILADIADRVGRRIGLPLHFRNLYPLVRQYAATRCFGAPVELDERRVRDELARSDMREAMTDLLAAAIAANLVVESPETTAAQHVALSATRPFHWRRNLPPLDATKTIFNHVATYNDFERRFAKFLDRAEDVTRFAALAATEQGANGVQFFVDYLKANGAIGRYYPDWVLRQDMEDGEMHWIVETKGREYPGTEEKDHAIRDWCRRVQKATGDRWWFARINQRDFDSLEDEVHTFGDLVTESLIRSFRRFRNRHLVEPMTVAEIKEAIDEGRE